MFDNSLKQNIVLSLDEKKMIILILQTIEKAKLTDLVNDLPNGLETILGEKVSGCQAVNDSELLLQELFTPTKYNLMDEATSALDEKNEEKIVEEIKNLKKQKTIIVIAHRLSTVKHCDKIYKLDKGRIVQEGSYERSSISIECKNF